MVNNWLEEWLRPLSTHNLPLGASIVDQCISLLAVVIAFQRTIQNPMGSGVASIHDAAVEGHEGSAKRLAGDRAFEPEILDFIASQ